MQMTMKKIFIMSVLLAITAHAVSSAGRCTSFIRNVLCSETGVAAGIVGLYAASSLYADELLVQKHIGKALAATVIPDQVSKEIRMACKQSGVKEQVNIIIGGKLTPATMFDGSHHILRVPAKCIEALQQRTVTIRYRGQQVVLTDDQVRFMLAHEAGHMKHAHFDNAVDSGFEVLHLPLTLLAGKAAYVAGRFKGLSVGVGALYALVHAGMHAWVKRTVEKRCDMSIDADLTHKGIGVLTTLQCVQEFEEYEAIEALQGGPLSESLVYWTGRFFSSHPPFSERIQYMQEKINNKKCE